MQRRYTCPLGHEWHMSIDDRFAPSEKWIVCPMCGDRPAASPNADAEAGPVADADTVARSRWSSADEEREGMRNDPDVRRPGRWSTLSLFALAGLLVIVTAGILAVGGIGISLWQARRIRVAMMEAEMAREVAMVEQERAEIEIQRFRDAAMQPHVEAHQPIVEQGAPKNVPPQPINDDVPKNVPLTLRRHDSEVWSVAFHPAGQHLVSGSKDHNVCIWDATTTELLYKLEGHTAAVTSVAFSPDGRVVASASWDQTVRLWDANKGQRLLTLKGHTAEVDSVAFHPAGRQIASASRDKTICIWDVETGQLVKTLLGHTEEVVSVAFRPDGQQIASAGRDHTIRLWDVASGKPLHVLDGHKQQVISVAFSPDGRRLASSSLDRTVRLWDAATGKLINTLDLPNNIANQVAFSPDSRQLALANDSGPVQIWDGEDGLVWLELRPDEHTAPIRSVAYSPDGKRIASASADRTVKVYASRRP